MRPLTTRESQVAHLVTNGWTNAQIAEHLTTSEQTVKNQLRAVYRKLGVENRVQLTRRILQGTGRLERTPH